MYCIQIHQLYFVKEILVIEIKTLWKGELKIFQQFPQRKIPIIIERFFILRPSTVS